MKFAKALIIRFEDLAVFLDAFDDVRLGYCHLFRRRELASQRRPDVSGFGQGAGAEELGKSARSVSQFFKERRVYYGHMLCTPDLAIWHFFYFSERDTDRDGHWKGGAGDPHLHFVNHLWPQHSAESVWQEFQTAKSVRLAAIHIRFRQLEESPDG